MKKFLVIGCATIGILVAGFLAFTSHFTITNWNGATEYVYLDRKVEVPIYVDREIEVEIPIEDGYRDRYHELRDEPRTIVTMGEFNAGTINHFNLQIGNGVIKTMAFAGNPIDSLNRIGFRNTMGGLVPSGNIWGDPSVSVSQLEMTAIRNENDVDFLIRIFANSAIITRRFTIANPNLEYIPLMMYRIGLDGCISQIVITESRNGGTPPEPVQYFAVAFVDENRVVYIQQVRKGESLRITDTLSAIHDSGVIGWVTPRHASQYLVFDLSTPIAVDFALYSIRNLYSDWAL
ncbi:MAG: hypothetical protein FWE45_03390 [Firmicutes bacterium]|nr:hypothetical protein [Bacillota bacterium]